MFTADVLAKVSASRELFISQTLRQSFFIDNQCAKSKSKQTCFSCLFAAVDVAQGRLPLGTGWAGQDWLLTSRRPQKHKVKVGFFQFDFKKDLFLFCINFNFTVWRPEFAKFPKFFSFQPAPPSASDEMLQVRLHLHACQSQAERVPFVEQWTNVTI